VIEYPVTALERARTLAGDAGAVRAIGSLYLVADLSRNEA